MNLYVCFPWKVVKLSGSIARVFITHKRPIIRKLVQVLFWNIWQNQGANTH